LLSWPQGNGADLGLVKEGSSGSGIAVMAKSRIETLFATRLYRGQLSPKDMRGLNADLAKTCTVLAAEDKAGQKWSRDHDYRGYTSYASLSDLPRRASIFAELAAHLDRHVRQFARALDFDTGGKRLVLDSLWINIMDEDAVHTAHIHPHAVISGTYYVSVPDNAAAIQFEDPRLGLMMAAPPRKKTARQDNKSFVSIAPEPGTVLLWESWLRHEVKRGRAKSRRAKRISVSFNYALG